jgi:hypothetical protein
MLTSPGPELVQGPGPPNNTKCRVLWVNAPLGQDHPVTAQRADHGPATCQRSIPQQGRAGYCPGLYSPEMLPWAQEIGALAVQNGFSGVAAVDRGGETEFANAYGLADRGWRDLSPRLADRGWPDLSPRLAPAPGGC